MMIKSGLSRHVKVFLSLKTNFLTSHNQDCDRKYELINYNN